MTPMELLELRDAFIRDLPRVGINTNQGEGFEHTSGRGVGCIPLTCGPLCRKQPGIAGMLTSKIRQLPGYIPARYGL